jgi:two-component system NtrC family sensor kinase
MSDAAQKHILLIEDSNTQAVRLMLYFESEGWRVSRATTAEEGLVLLAEDPPDLLVVDYYLPGIQGDTFCRQVRLNANTRHIPMLMLTAAESDDAQLQGLESGADDYLPKSEPIDVLLLRMHALLRRPALATGGSFQQARLLAIDDSPTYLAYLEAELQQEGYLIDTACSGEAGLEKARQGHYDCVLVDLVMPGLDGIAVCEALSNWSQQNLSPLLILMLTAHDNPTDLSRALAAGADDFVGKGNDISVLRGRVRALLRRKFSQDENQRLLQQMLELKEQEAQHAREAQEAAEARASMAHELEIALKKLQLSKTELEQLATISAHDLQEPLRQLANYTEMLQRRYSPQLDAQAVRYMDFIQQNTRRMQQQVRSLLSYLSISNQPLVIAPLDLQALLNELQAHFSENLETCQAQLQLVPPLPVIQGSRFHLRCLFQHLLQNALDFRRPGVPLQIQIRCQTSPAFWDIEVEDNGQGIESQYFERIFQFFQALEDRRGQGMGLPICRKIAAMHQGQLSLRSVPAQGSVFCLRLPRY